MNFDPSLFYCSLTAEYVILFLTLESGKYNVTIEEEDEDEAERAVRNDPKLTHC